ncbi:hypothetical protein JCM11251_005718 [Rhodosporidiobolus azoricus]
MSPSSSASASEKGERPAFPPLTRQHSRSSSQLATFAALALSPVSTSNPPLPRPGTPPRGGRHSLGGSPRFGAFASLSSSPRGKSSRRGSISSDSDESISSGRGGEGEGTPREREHGRTDSGSTAATSGGSDKSSSNRTPQALKDRRSTFPSVSSPLNLPTVTSTSPSPAASPAAPTGAAFRRSNSASTSPLASPSLPPTDSATSTSAAISSFPSTSTSLAQFIQHKRRQASAPYFASARERSLFSPGAGFSLGPGSTNAGQGDSDYFGGWGNGVGGNAAAARDSRRSSLDRDLGAGAASLPPSRSRSRASSRRGTTSGLLLQTGGLLLGVPGGETADPSAGLVVTPTTAEWRQLGEELVDLQEKREKERERKRTGGVAEGRVNSLTVPSGRSAKEGGEDEEEEEEEKVKTPIMPRWKRWASLRDSDEDAADDDDEDASSDDEEGDEFALSLSLSRFSKFKQNHQLPHTPPPLPSPSVHAPGTASAPATTPAALEEPARPPIPKSYKSSFSYSSSGGGANGGFTSHSNTSSLSSIHYPLSTTSSAGSSAWNLSLSVDPSDDLSSSASEIAAARRGSAPDTDPLPHAETFASTSTSGSSTAPSFSPGHATRRSESAIAVPSYLQPHRPALSRGSLSSATGGLSSPSPPASVAGSAPGSVPMSASGSSDKTTTGYAAGHEREVDRKEEAEEKDEPSRREMRDEETPSPARSRRPSVPRIPLPPNVFRSLDQGEGGSASIPYSFASSPQDGQPGSTDGKGSPTVAVTPLSVAATPYDGDPFSSLAPPDVSQYIPPTPSVAPDTPSIPTAQPVDLDWTKPMGPVDPRTYSAVTGLRDINSFVVEGDEAGKGAYGSVRRAREKGKDGKAVGPPLIIKYVIKQRILADCWKKHKILGPIPIEVHVLDHLRRVPYEPRPAFHYLSSSSRAINGSGRKPKSGAPVRRDSAPKLDLWTGGEGGGTVRTGHPNVCGLLDFFEDNEFYMLVMPQATASPSSCSSLPTSQTSSTDFQPLKHGQDLFDHVDANPTGLPPSEIRHILRQLTDALWFLHEHSIVHRDIKDENVVLDGDGTVRLIDFGSAAYVKEGRKFDTFSGTLDFAAPEVLKGARYGGKEQDVWALGVLGYVIVCGECPFWSPDEATQGLNPSTRALFALQSKLSSSPTSPTTRTSNSSAPLNSASAAYAAVEAALDASSPPLMADAVDLVQRCLEIDPLNRPTADIICDHVFLAGKGGWSGFRGWEKGDEDENGDGVDEGEEADGEREE